MNVLLVGAGGRKHALAWKLRQSPLLDRLVTVPGNPGTERLGKNVPLTLRDLDGIVDLARREQVGLVVVGPAAYLFDDPLAAASFVRSSGRAWVVKADGLAFGKGVVVAEDVDATLEAIAGLVALPGGGRLLLEERLRGASCRCWRCAMGIRCCHCRPPVATSG